VNYRLHPDAALEHEEQITYYERHRPGLGQRYHRAALRAIESACRSPRRFKIARPPNIRKIPLRGFPFTVVYREVDAMVQVLAVAHHRREPHFWTRRT
jgi:toxin ParE1/3/4